MNEDKLEMLAVKGKACIKKHSKRAIKASFIPILSIPLVHGICAAMQSELDKIFDIGKAKDEKHSNIVLGAIATPLMLIPLWGAVPAEAYVQTVGENYVKALIKMHRETLSQPPVADLTTNDL